MHVHGHWMNPALYASDVSRNQEIALAARKAAETRKKLANFAALFGETAETADGTERVTIYRDAPDSDGEERHGSGSRSSFSVEA